MACVGVVIPLHDKERYIQRCLDSVLGQAHGDLEVVVVDDGSMDGSAALVSQRGDSRIRLIRTQCHGPGAARNLGMRCLRTEWVGFLDADDTWDPLFIEKTLRAASEYPGVVAVFTDIVRANAHNRPASGGLITDYFTQRMDRFISMSSSTLLVNRARFGSMGGFREDMRYAEDSEAWFRLSCEGPCYYLAEPLAHIETTDPAAATRRLDFQARVAGLRALLDSHERYLQSGRIPRGCRRGCRRFMRHQRGRLAVQLLTAGRSRAALKTLVSGVPPGRDTWREYLQCAVLLLRAIARRVSSSSRRRSPRPTR